MDGRDLLRNPAIAAAVDQAVLRGDRRLFDLLCRHSNLPGPRPNYPLARAVARQLGQAGARADAVVAALCAFDIRRAPAGTTQEFLPIVGAMALGDRYRSGDRPAEALEALRTLAEDPRQLVRGGVTTAVREIALVDAGALAAAITPWLDGYLPAAVAAEALAAREVLDRLRSADAILGVLDAAFSLLESAPRSHQRSQGYRTLLAMMAEAPVRVMDRFAAATLSWLERRADTRDPDVRRVIETLIERGAASGHGAGRMGDLERALGRSAPPRRDPKTYVGPTRQRGKRRR